MSNEFIKMISDWQKIKYPQTIQNLAANKTPCAAFLPSVRLDTVEDFRKFFNKRKLNFTHFCVLNDEDKKLVQPVEGENVVTLEEFATLDEKPKYVFTCKGFFSLMFMDYFKSHRTIMFGHNGAHKAEDRYNLYMKHLPELYDVHEMLADDESKKVFRAAITGKITNIVQDFRFAPEPQYFLEGFLPTEGDISIDGGAFDGATSADFARQGAQVYAFEMNATNYQNCIALAEEFGFTIENLGLSNQAGEAYYSVGKAGSRKLANDSGGGIAGQFIDLDTYVAQKNLPRVDYIKLDVEGAELDVLHGAAKTITRWKPKMAVSAYHKPEDLWTLATYIKSLRGDYEFQFRHYRIDCTNYLFSDNNRALFRSFGLSYFCPSHCEMVLYCK